MLREDARQGGRVAETEEVVTVCDHLFLLTGRQTEAEVVRESTCIPPDRLVQGLRGNSVKTSKIGVHDHPLAADRENDRIGDGRDKTPPRPIARTVLRPHGEISWSLGESPDNTSRACPGGSTAQLFRTWSVRSRV